MGDTLMHLPHQDDLSGVIAMVAESLETGGRFVMSFRDYTSPLLGTKRFIAVGSDSDRILTCFLEFAPEHVTVHDVLQERINGTWQLRVSAYPQLRVSPGWISSELEALGFSVRQDAAPGGMVRLSASI